MDLHRTPWKCRVVARAASLAIGALALADSTLWSRSDCSEWNTRGFFARAGVADMARCLDNGKRLTDRDDRGLTPLHNAAAYSGPAQVRALLDRGADLYALDRDGRTPLYLAAEKRGLPENVTTLLNAGAKVDARDEGGRTPLHAAAHKGTLASVRVLLNAGAALDVRDDRDATPLHMAAGHDAPANTIELLRAGADPGERDEWGGTALHVAAKGQRSFSNIKPLLDAGARVDGRERLIGRTPLHLAAWTGAPAGIAVLLEAGADVSAKNDVGQTPMHLAATFNRADNIAVLAATGADPNARDISGRTPLHDAAAWGEPEAIAALVAAGAELEARDFQLSWTPLREAAEQSKPRNKTALLEAGADPATVDEGEAKLSPEDLRGEGSKSKPASPQRPVPADCSQWNGTAFFLRAAPADVARCIDEGSSLSQGLLFAAGAGRPEHVAALLDAGAEVGTRDRWDSTPLHVAAANAIGEAFDQGLVDIRVASRLEATNLTVSTIAVLLNAGADLHARDKYGDTPLHSAAWQGWSEYVAALVDAGADLEARNEPARTPLHSAVIGPRISKKSVSLAKASSFRFDVESRDRRTARELATIAVLLDAGAEVGARDNDGWTPLHAAAVNGIPGHIAAIAEAGADIHAGDDEGDTPLHLAVMASTTESIDALLAARASLEARNNDGRTPLHMAAKYGTEHIPSLLGAGAAPDARDEANSTPLHVAAAFGTPQGITMLLEAGAEVNAENSIGQRPLHLAARYGSAENVMALLDAGADPAIKDSDGKLARDHAQSRWRILDAETFRQLDPSSGAGRAGR